MKYSDLCFEMINDRGLLVNCDITKVIPNPENSEEPFVTYTDYMLDENDEFITMYGKVVFDGKEYKLVKITDQEIINKIVELSKDEVVTYVNKEIQEGLTE